MCWGRFNWLVGGRELMPSQMVFSWKYLLVNNDYGSYSVSLSLYLSMYFQWPCFGCLCCPTAYQVRAKTLTYSTSDKHSKNVWNHSCPLSLKLATNKNCCYKITLMIKESQHIFLSACLKFSGNVESGCCSKNEYWLYHRRAYLVTKWALKSPPLDY